MRKYEFPAKRNDIDNCYDVEQLKQWQHGFEQTLNQIEADFGGVENVPEKLYKYAIANKYNLQQIDFKIRKLNSPVSSVGALKCFHDTAKELLPEAVFENIVNNAKIRLGKKDCGWEELISKNNHGRRRV
jgi:hypothetical protein